MDGLITSHALLPLSQSDDDLAQRLREFVQDKDAFAPNTWRQLMSVMRVCHRWALANNRLLLPMSPEDLRDYLSYLQSIGRASSTIGTHQSLITMLHRNAGLVPPSTSPLVSRAVKKINRVAVVSGERTGQAVGDVERALVYPVVYPSTGQADGGEDEDEGADVADERYAAL